jgi:hypothetical protein
MPLDEFEFRPAVKGFRSNPVIEPRHFVGSHQRRLWSVGSPRPEGLIPDKAQQGSQQQTGSYANGGEEAIRITPHLPLS